jgi:putative transposase
VIAISRETSRGKATRTQVCEAFSLSRQAFYAASRPPSEKRTTGARPRAGGREIVPAQVLEDGIRGLVEDYPAWGTRKIWARLRKDGMRASYKRVWSIMTALGLTFTPGTRRHSDCRGHVSVPDSNRRWATDLTTAWTTRNGWVAIVPVIDCGDRVVLDIEVTKSQESGCVLRPFERALERHFGSPLNVPSQLELRTDHGPQYTGVDCDNVCSAWRVNHTFAPVGRPTGNSVVERFIQTLKVELIWTRDWESEEELRIEIHRWLISYNNNRPHQALNWLTPFEKRCTNLAPAGRRHAA